MLSFQKLRAYQRSIEFLALTIEVIGNLPKGHSDLADQLLRAAQSQLRNIAEVQAGARRWMRLASTRMRVARRWKRALPWTRCAS